MKVLITGVTGQTGSYLADFLLAKHPEAEVHGTVRYRSDTENIANIRHKLKLHDCELRDAHNTEKTIARIKPDLVFHLAATSFVRSSWDQPADIIVNNVTSQINLFEALLRHSPKARVHIAGSSEQFGKVEEHEVPITEKNELRPISPYAVSKCAQEHLAYQYYHSYGLHTVITRTFNHSVHPSTPILIKTKGLIDVIRIDELKRAREKGANHQEWDIKEDGIEVWADNQWALISHVSAHKIQDEGRGKLIQVTTCPFGTVETTDNHSIIGPNGDSLKARDLIVGSQVKMVDLPNTDNKTVVSLDLAWLYGIISAEGNVHQRGERSYRISISNTELSYIERCERIIESHYGITSRRSENQSEGKKLLYTCSFDNYGLGVYLTELFYTREGEKRIPIAVLNSTPEVMIEFLRGYNDGDGLESGKDSGKRRQAYEFQRFGTNSSVLALGLLYLISNTTNQDFNVSRVLPGSTFTGSVHPENFNGYFKIDLRSPRKLTIKGACQPKPGDCVKKIEMYEYDGFVYDLTTSSNTFHAGVGCNLVHNTSPRRGDAFVESSFARQVAEIEMGVREPIIYHGNLDSVRDYTDARDVAEAYWQAIHKCNPGEPYNICSNMRITIGELLQMFIRLSTYKGTIETKIDPARLRPSDVVLLYGSSAKFNTHTGWSPTYSLETTMGGLLNAWRTKMLKQSIMYPEDLPSDPSRCPGRGFVDLTEDEMGTGEKV